jgi:Rrf2 family protein
VYISARVDYATRALLVLAASDGRPVRGEVLATSQGLPVKFVENTLLDLRRAGLVSSQRGRDGGYRLAKPAKDIAVADVIRALEGPLAEVNGVRPEHLAYEGPAEHLQDVWVATRAALRMVLEGVTLADVIAAKLPRSIGKLLDQPGAWEGRPLGRRAPSDPGQ